MQDMRNCYDSLLSAAAATANSAYGKSFLLRLICTLNESSTSNLVATLTVMLLELIGVSTV